MMWFSELYILKTYINKLVVKNFNRLKTKKLSTPKHVINKIIIKSDERNLFLIPIPLVFSPRIRLVW